MRLSTGASEETSPEGDRPRFRSRPPNAIDTGALPARAACKSPRMLPMIHLDSGSSERGVPDLLRSLFHSVPHGAFLGPISGDKPSIGNRVTCRLRPANIRQASELPPA